MAAVYKAESVKIMFANRFLVTWVIGVFTGNVVLSLLPDNPFWLYVVIAPACIGMASWGLIRLFVVPPKN